jgi:hypothetical protein
MKSVMLDLETIGGSPDGVIVQIGACRFDPLTGEIGNTFSLNVDPISGQNKGFNIDADTVLWWLKQSAEARNSVFGEDKAPLHIFEAITRLNIFLGGGAEIWSHSTFDFVIIMNHFKKLGIKPNFTYKDARDIRTLVALAGLPKTDVKREGIHHNALDDCRFQVKYCVECIQTLNMRRNDGKL